MNLEFGGKLIINNLEMLNLHNNFGNLFRIPIFKIFFNLEYFIKILIQMIILTNLFKSKYVEYTII